MKLYINGELNTPLSRKTQEILVHKSAFHVVPTACWDPSVDTQATCWQVPQQTEELPVWYSHPLWITIDYNEFRKQEMKSYRWTSRAWFNLELLNHRSIPTNQTQQTNPTLSIGRWPCLSHLFQVQAKLLVRLRWLFKYNIPYRYWVLVGKLHGHDAGNNCLVQVPP